MICPFCAEDIAPASVKCSLCGEPLAGRREVLEWATQGVEPDPTLAKKLIGWPEDSLVRAMRDHQDEYTPAERRAIIDEAGRRGLAIPERRGRSAIDVAVTVLGLCFLLALLGLVLAPLLRL